MFPTSLQTQRPHFEELEHHWSHHPSWPQFLLHPISVLQQQTRPEMFVIIEAEITRPDIANVLDIIAKPTSAFRRAGASLVPSPQFWPHLISTLQQQTACEMHHHMANALDMIAKLMLALCEFESILGPVASRGHNLGFIPSQCCSSRQGVRWS